MQKQITSILLVAGTCIGGGIIALPMTLANLGIIPISIIMIMTWLLTYYTSLVSVELNLQSDRGLSLGALGKKFSGNIAGAIGVISVKLLSYALLTVFISGMSSIIQKLIESHLHCDISMISVETWISLFTMIILLFPLSIVSKINNVAFAIFFLTFVGLTGIMIASVDYTKIPWFVDPNIKNIISIITVVFTSFGFQVIFHTLRDYYGKNTKALRRAFFYGSMIPTAVYMLWTNSSLSAILKSNPGFFSRIVAGTVEVGDFVKELSNISGVSCFHVLVWMMAIFAIFTSVLGVGVGLYESLNSMMKNKVQSSRGRKLLSSLITVLPPYVAVVLIPNAFIKILKFAGTILVVIAILLPIYLFLKARFKNLYIRELQKWTLVICAIIGICIIAIELFTNS